MPNAAFPRMMTDYLRKRAAQLFPPRELERLRLQTRANSFDSTADWPALELKDLPVRRSGAQFWFALPERWLADQQPLKLEWVDRYR